MGDDALVCGIGPQLPSLRTVCNISKLPAHVIEQIRVGLRKGAAADLPSGPLRVERQREYGVSYALLDLARQLELDRLIYARKEPWREDALSLIVGRMVYQGLSELATQIAQAQNRRNGV